LFNSIFIQIYVMNLSQQFIVFCFVGIFSTIMDLSILLGLVQLKVLPLIAVTISFMAGMLVNILLHAYLTFRTHLNNQRVVRFLMILCINYAFTLGTVLIFEQLGFNYLMGKIVSLPVIAIHGFLWSRLWIFKT